MFLSKVEAARRQLGTALALFIENQDPVSIHSLACGGGEMAEQLADKAAGAPFRSHILETFPDMNIADIKRLRNKYWNALKHALGRDGLERQDEELLAEFSDDQNDHALFIGWYDYAMATDKLPIEAQAFQVWYYTKYPEKMRSPFEATPLDEILAGMKRGDRLAQKQILKKLISFARRMEGIMDDPKTDPRSLVLGNM
jgi:hypothetical protein